MYACCSIFLCAVLRAACKLPCHAVAWRCQAACGRSPVIWRGSGAWHVCHQNVYACQNLYAYYSCSAQNSSGVPDGSDWLSCACLEPGTPVPMRCMHHVGSDHPAVRYMRVRVIGVASSVPRWVFGCRAFGFCLQREPGRAICCILVPLASCVDESVPA